MIKAAVLGAWRSVVAAAQAVGRPDARRRSLDRRILEDEILPWLAGRDDIRRVLFVGCARYTRHYEAFFSDRDYRTIDPTPRRRRWGADRHIVDRLEHLGRHVAPASLDAIVCNGVLGWGLNRRDDAEAAFDACRAALRPGGELIVGWNDVAPRNRVRPDSLHSLGRFDNVPLPGYDVVALSCGSAHRHVFVRYRCVDESSAVHGRSRVGPSGAMSDSGRQSASTQST